MFHDKDKCIYKGAKVQSSFSCSGWLDIVLSTKLESVRSESATSGFQLQMLFSEASE